MEPCVSKNEKMRKRFSLCWFCCEENTEKEWRKGNGKKYLQAESRICVFRCV